MKTRILIGIFLTVILTIVMSVSVFAQEDNEIKRVAVDVSDRSEVLEVDPDAEIIGKYDKDTLKVETENAVEMVKEIPGAKIDAKAKIYTGGYTNDTYNNPNKLPYLYNNGIFTLHQKGYKGSGVEIAVIDTDISSNLSEISANIDWTNAYNAITKKPLLKDGAAKDDHSTMIAGVIAGKHGNSAGVAGVAPAAKILPVMISNGQSGGYMENYYNALEYLDGLLDAGKVPNLKVINISSGFMEMDDSACHDNQKPDYYLNVYYQAQEVKDLIDHIRTAHKVTIVCAQGNYGEEYIVWKDGPNKGKKDWLGDNYGFPGDLPGVVSVGMTDKYNMISGESSFRPDTDLIAAGADVALLKSNGKYMIGSGTSFSAPVVSGIFALMYGKNKNKTESDILSALKTTGTKLKPELGGPKRRVDVVKALETKKVLNATKAFNKLFGTSYTIDTQYAFKSPAKTIEDRKSSVPYKKANIMGDWNRNGINIYGLSWSDIPSETYSRTLKDGVYTYKITVKGTGFVTRSTSYTVKKTPAPVIKITKQKGKCVIKYKKVDNDSIRIQIYSGGKLYKTVKIQEESLGKDSESRTLPSTYRTKTITVDKSSYTVKTDVYEHLDYSSSAGTKYIDIFK